MEARNAAIFLDRDGVIIDHVDHISRPEQVKLINKAADAISLLNKNYKIILITNQAAVGRGICTERDANKVNEKMLAMLAQDEAKIDATYMCFHHPVHGIGKYKQDCNCRKPKPGMILKAQVDFNIDLKKSYIIGDSTQDIKAGNLAGLKTILVKTGYAGKDRICPDAAPSNVAEDLYSAAQIILGDKK